MQTSMKPEIMRIPTRSLQKHYCVTNLSLLASVTGTHNLVRSFRYIAAIHCLRAPKTRPIASK